MFAVVKVGSSQYKVKEGDTIDTCRLSEEEGNTVTLDQVLMVASEKDVRVGQPFLKDAKITAKIVRHIKAAKVIAFKFRARKHFRNKKAHRRALTTINITKISA